MHATALLLSLSTKPLVKMLARQVRPLLLRKQSYSTAGTMLAGTYLILAATRPAIKSAHMIRKWAYGTVRL